MATKHINNLFQEQKFAESMEEREGDSSFHELDSMQNIVERPARPAGNDLRPDLLWDCITWIQQTPVGTRFWLDPLKIFNLAPAILMVGTVMVQGLKE